MSIPSLTHLQVFDQMMKRMSSRRQKRWWNAYILFYTRTDTDVTTPPSAADGALQTAAHQLRQLSLSQYWT